MRFRALPKSMSSLLAIACIAAISTGCPDEEEANPDAATVVDAGRPDAGGNPDAAGGEDLVPIGDADVAPDADGFPDAATFPDAGPNAPVTVRTVVDDQPVGDIPVVFHDQNGDVLSSTVTGANGEASFEVPAGGMVTSLGINLLRGGKGPEIPALHTIVGVQPGETYVWPLSPSFGVPDVLVGNIVVTLPGAVTGADFYNIEFGCEGYSVVDPATATTFDLTSGCVGTSTVVDILAVAKNFNSEILAYAVARDVPVGNNVPVSFGAWVNTLRANTVTVVNAPMEIESADVTLRLVRRGVHYVRSQSNQAFSTSVISVPFMLPDFGDSRDLELGFSIVPQGNSLYSGRFDAHSQLDFDFVTANMPYMTAVTLDRSGDASRPVITWTIGQGTPTNMFMVGFNTDVVNWTVLVPPSTTSVKQPALPEELAYLRPDVNTGYSEPFALFLNTSLYPTYDAYRVALGPLGFFALFIGSQIPADAPIGTRISAAAVGSQR